MFGIVFFTVSMVALLYSSYLSLRTEVGHRSSLRLIWLYCSIVGCLAVGILGLNGWGLLPVLLQNFGLVGICLLLSGLCWWYIVSWSWRKKRAGRLVLDLGQPNRLNCIFYSAGVVLLGFFLLIAQGRLGGPTDLAFIGLIISLAILCLFVGNTRLQIRARGIQYLGNFFGWERVVAYSWERPPESEAVLVVKILRQLSFPFSTKLNCPIPPQYQEEAEKAILLQSILATLD